MMPISDATPILLLLVLFQVKHFICDAPLQTGAMVRDKGHYGRVLGIVHAGIHGAGTLGTLLLFGALPLLAVKLALLDFVIHYHVDFSKEQIVRRAGWTTSVPQFWWALSADQMMHQLTYLLLAWLVFAGF
ncbi:MAG: DUF3307 domain-containing protein [Rhizobiales bacterium]|nr:DUF3307 domain-containing protein [Hyphomicrobiales bacterium]